jgi:hypothetical protein
MSLEKKTKVALDETRLLLLGSTILLGFQFQGVFHDLFKDLAPHAKAATGTGLMLMVLTIGLLVAPSVRHRLAEQGSVSNRLLAFITLLAGLALFPFAISLGLALFISLEVLAGTTTAIVAGALFAALALWFWYGLEFWQREQQPEKPMSRETHRVEPPLSTRIDQMLTEARVLLPGAQALLGFQLVIVLSKSFSEIPTASKTIHACALGSIALTIILLMAPAAYHRIVYGGDDSDDMHRTGSNFITAATVPLALGIVGDVYVTIEHIAHSPAMGAAAAAVALLVLFGLWLALPLMARQRLSPLAKRDLSPSTQQR